MERLSNIHPGEVLLEEFLKPNNISAYRLSKDIGIPQTRTSEIIKGNRSITADTALRLSYYFGNSAKFWLGLQNDFDLEKQKKIKAKDLKRIKRIQEPAAWKKIKIARTHNTDNAMKSIHPGLAKLNNILPL